MLFNYSSGFFFFCLASFSSRETLSFLSLRGEKPPTSWLKWLKQLQIYLYKCKAGYKRSQVNGSWRPRFVQISICSAHFCSLRPRGRVRSRVHPNQSSALLGSPCWRALLKKSSTKWYQRSNRIRLMQGKKCIRGPTLECDNPSPLQAATELEESTWHGYNYG